MRSNLVYDLPTRIMHWLFAGFFLVAFVIAQYIDDDSPIYSYHMLAGIVLGFLVLPRIIWGLVGTQHARFSNFRLKPKELFDYLKGIISGDRKRWAGHNPASSWAAIIMYAMAVGLGITGYLMTSGPDKEVYEDIHELFSNVFIITAILHIAGIALHTYRHKDMLGLSMVDGNKSDINPQDTISSSRPVSGILLIALIVIFTSHLFTNYNSETRVLKLFGKTLQMGENDSAHDKRHEDDDDDDDD